MLLHHITILSFMRSFFQDSDIGGQFEMRGLDLPKLGLDSPTVSLQTTRFFFKYIRSLCYYPNNPFLRSRTYVTFSSFILIVGTYMIDLFVTRNVLSNEVTCNTCQLQSNVDGKLKDSDEIKPSGILIATLRIPRGIIFISIWCSGIMKDEKYTFFMLQLMWGNMQHTVLIYIVVQYIQC